jgi:hypothetical protein
MKPKANYQLVRINIKSHVWSKIHYSLMTPELRGATKVTLWDIEKLVANSTAKIAKDS